MCNKVKISQKITLNAHTHKYCITLGWKTDNRTQYTNCIKVYKRKRYGPNGKTSSTVKHHTDSMSMTMRGFRRNSINILGSTFESAHEIITNGIYLQCTQRDL